MHKLCCNAAVSARTFRQRYGPMLRRAVPRARAPHRQTLHAGEESSPHAASARARARAAYRQAPLSIDRTAPRSPPRPR